MKRLLPALLLLAFSACTKEEMAYPCKVSYSTAKLYEASTVYRATFIDCFPIPPDEITSETEIYQCLREEISNRVGDTLVILEILPYNGVANVWSRNPCE